MIIKTTFLLIAISLNTVLFAEVTDKKLEFTIFTTSLYSSDLNIIGSALFDEKYLNYNSKKVLYYTIDLSFQNLGVLKREKYEVVGDANSLDFIFSKYQDFENHQISFFKEGKKLRVSNLTYNTQGDSRVLQVSQSFFPATFLYIKLSRAIGSENEVNYWALEEDRLAANNFIDQGRAIYQGFNEVEILNTRKKLHMFLNSFSSERAQIFFDENKVLYAIKLFKSDQSIVFLRK